MEPGPIERAELPAELVDAIVALPRPAAVVRR